MIAFLIGIPAAGAAVLLWIIRGFLPYQGKDRESGGESA